MKPPILVVELSVSADDPFVDVWRKIEHIIRLPHTRVQKWSMSAKRSDLSPTKAEMEILVEMQSDVEETWTFILQRLNNSKSHLYLDFVSSIDPLFERDIPSFLAAVTKCPGVISASHWP